MMLLDFNICTDRVVKARRLNIVVVDKQNSGATIMEIAVPEDFRVKNDELEQILKYQDTALRIVECAM